MGVLIVEFSIGMVETFSSPSSFATITLVIVLVSIGRLNGISHEQPASETPPGYYWAWVPYAPGTTTATAGYGQAYSQRAHAPVPVAPRRRII
jgi:hypothetical protein